MSTTTNATTINATNATNVDAHDLSPTDETQLGRLRWWNAIVGLVHLAQALVILAISNDFTLPITAAFLGGPPGAEFTEREVLWNVPIGYGVAFFLLLAAVDHLLMAAPGSGRGTPPTSDAAATSHAGGSTPSVPH